jgi:hypothetical protein
VTLLPLLIQHTNGMLKDNLPAGVFYVPAYELYDHSDWTFDPVRISTLKNQHLSVIDYSSENYISTAVDAYNYFTELGINFILLSHDPRDHLRHPNIIFYPYYYYWTNEKFTQFDVDISSVRNFKIASLSRRPVPHRIINYVRLRNKPYFDSTVITAHRNDNPMPDEVRGDEMTLPADIKSQWDQIYPTLPTMPVLGTDSFHLLHPGYTDSYVNLIVETTVTKGFFITEKTWKPILRGQLFLAWSNAGGIEHLRDLGVDVFDDIIDHKYYDNEQDPSIRLDKIHTVLDHLATQDLDSIFQQTLTRRTSNLRKFKNGEFGARYRDQLNKCINMLN